MTYYMEVMRVRTWCNTVIQQSRHQRSIHTCIGLGQLGAQSLFRRATKTLEQLA